MSGAPEQESFTDECFLEYLKLIHQLSGITIGANRKTMVQGRLRRRMRELSLGSYENYLNYLAKNSSERPYFIDLITTNETYFFRTPRIWEYLEKRFLPNWWQKNPEQSFRAWSAAASSGEEAHSLGIVLQDFKSKNPKFSYQILGTDISQEMVSLCQQGLYKGKAIESFKNFRPDLFNKYLRKSPDGSCRVASEIKSQLKFQTHNLFDSLRGNPEFDLILLRNVLIYFKPADQETVLERIRPHLKPGGVLVIGESESLILKLPFLRLNLWSTNRPPRPLVRRPDEGTRSADWAG